MSILFPKKQGEGVEDVWIAGVFCESGAKILAGLPEAAFLMQQARVVIQEFGVAREFFKLQEDHSVLVKTTTKSIAQLTKDNERLTKELAAAMKELKRQQENVCMPLVAECTKREN